MPGYFWRIFLPVNQHEKALKIPDISAWVTSEDQLAVVGALPFLKAKGIKIPEEISIVAFNDSIDAAFNDLTSYSFDIQSMAYRMLRLIYNPPASQKGAEENQVVLVAGELVRRDSVRMLRKRS
jgi:DNA-binding LacI/PurR family transcriptional regulator